MRLAIVGSVRLAGNPEAAAIIESVLDQYRPDVVVSGDADGIDRMAQAAAERRGIKVQSYPPKRRTWHGPGGFRERNLLIAGDCDRLVRIISSLSRTYGSGWTRDQAKKRGVPTEEFIVTE